MLRHGVIPPSLTEPVGAAVEWNNSDIDSNGNEGRERNTELEARSTRGDRAIPAPTQWSDLKVNDLKAFILHQNTIPSNRALVRF